VRKNFLFEKPHCKLTYFTPLLGQGPKVIGALRTSPNLFSVGIITSSYVNKITPNPKQQLISNSHTLRWVRTRGIPSPLPPPKTPTNAVVSPRHHLLILEHTPIRTRDPVPPWECRRKPAPARPKYGICNMVNTFRV